MPIEDVKTSICKQRKQFWPFIKQRTYPNGTTAWIVDCRTKDGGSRRAFDSKTDAETFASQQRILRGNEGTMAVSLPERLRVEAVECERQLAQIGATLTDATKFFLQHSKPSGGENTITEAVAEFLAAKKKAGRRESYISMQGYVLGRVFDGVFGKRLVHQISAIEIDEWMNGKHWSDRTRRNYFQDLRNFFGFCVRRGYCVANPMFKIEKPSVDEKRPGLLTVEQTSNLLAEAEADDMDGMLPAIAIGLFAGCRTGELEQIEWKHVDFEAKTIEIPASISKTREGRYIAMSDNLVQWLKTCAKTKGQIAPEKCFDYHYSRLARAAGIEQKPHNALRHSFGSYHYALHGNAPLTASQLGHEGSTRTLFKHYRALAKEKQARLYFSITPPAEAALKVADFTVAL